MTVPLVLLDINNASNPLSVENIIARNNRAIEEAFTRVLSREETEEHNFMCVHLDMNGNDLINVGYSPFIRQDELHKFQVGEIRVNPETRDLEYRPLNSEKFEVLYTLSELQTGGPSLASLLSGNNLADVEDAEEARSNLGLEIGLDVLPYSPFLDVTSPLFGRKPIVQFGDGDTSIEGSNVIYVPDSPDGSESSFSLTLSDNVAPGCVNTVYIPEFPFSFVGLIEKESADQILLLNGSSTDNPSIAIPQGTLATISCVSPDGNVFVVDGVGISEGSSVMAEPLVVTVTPTLDTVSDQGVSGAQSDEFLSTVIGGTPPYSYMWSSNVANGVLAQQPSSDRTRYTIFQTPPGSTVNALSLTVVDSNGVTATSGFQITTFNNNGFGNPGIPGFGFNFGIGFNQ